MSTAKRVISGSIASWMRIGITMLSQILFVPLYLSYWDVNTYGVWIAIQALVSIISTLDQGHQTFLEFEFLRHGRAQKDKIAFDLWSSVWIALALGLVEVIIVIVFMMSGIVGELLGTSSTINGALVKDAGIVLLMQMISWAFLTSLGGVFVRALSPFGYYARMSWWGVCAAIFTSLVPVIAVVFGADLLQAGIALVIATVGYAIPQYYDVYRLIKKEGVWVRHSSIKRGLSNLFMSTAISGKSLLENARQQGVRVILAPLSGASGLVAFSTMRTGANIVLQGLNTITSPLMPELMRFLNQKDQQRMEASFGTVWFVVMLLLAPGVVLLQAFAAPLFTLWTKGAVAFDPILFALLSMGVLVFAVAQPAMAVIRGNNLLRPQLIIAVIAATIVIAGMFILVPIYGIEGAGFSLLLAEIAATTGYRIVAKKWLRANGLEWPARSSAFALTSIWSAAAVMIAMICLNNIKWLFLGAGIVVLGFVFFLYWKTLPPMVSSKAKSILQRVPVVKKIIS